MDLEYKISGYHFQNRKKVFYEGKISLFPDGKIVGLSKDEDYNYEGKKFVFGFYKKEFITNLYFIRTSQLNESIKKMTLYSLTKENFNSESFEGTYKGFWIGVEPYFEGRISKALGIPEMEDRLRNIFQQKPEESLKKLEDLYFLPIIVHYFSEDILERLDSVPNYIREKAELTISKT